MANELFITRVVNACVLIEIGVSAVLTDPYFDAHWFMRMNEPIGLDAAALPPLAAILGGHRVFDHWQPRSLRAYPFKHETPVYVAASTMKAQARAAGFAQVEVLGWGNRRQLGEGLELEVAPAQTAMGMRVNSYVLSTAKLRIFIGTEARDLAPLQQYRAQRPAVDVAVLPIDGSALLGHQLVMRAADAIEGARILGAKTLVPIHHALKALPGLLQVPGSLADFDGCDPRGVTVVPLKTGHRWRLPPIDSAPV